MVIAIMSNSNETGTIRNEGASCWAVEPPEDEEAHPKLQTGVDDQDPSSISIDQIEDTTQLVETEPLDKKPPIESHTKVLITFGVVLLLLIIAFTVFAILTYRNTIIIPGIDSETLHTVTKYIGVALVISSVILLILFYRHRIENKNKVIESLKAKIEKQQIMTGELVEGQDINNENRVISYLKATVETQEMMIESLNEDIIKLQDKKRETADKFRMGGNISIEDKNELIKSLQATIETQQTMIEELSEGIEQARNQEAAARFSIQGQEALAESQRTRIEKQKLEIEKQKGKITQLNINIQKQTRVTMALERRISRINRDSKRNRYLEEEESKLNEMIEIRLLDNMYGHLLPKKDSGHTPSEDNIARRLNKLTDDGRTRTLYPITEEKEDAENEERE